MWGVWLDLSCVHVYRPPLQSVQQAVAAGPRRTAQPAGQQRPASQPVSVFCNFLFLLLPHFLCIYVCVCPALDPDFTAISRASALVPLGSTTASWRGGSSKCAPGWQRAKARLTVLQLHLKMMYQQFRSGLGAGGDVDEQVETRSASLRF